VEFCKRLFHSARVLKRLKRDGMQETGGKKVGCVDCVRRMDKCGEGEGVRRAGENREGECCSVTDWRESKGGVCWRCDLRMDDEA
jgi:hypothetical protein